MGLNQQPVFTREFDFINLPPNAAFWKQSVLVSTFFHIHVHSTCPHVHINVHVHRFTESKGKFNSNSSDATIPALGDVGL